MTAKFHHSFERNNARSLSKYKICTLALGAIFTPSARHVLCFHFDLVKFIIKRVVLTDFLTLKLCSFILITDIFS